MQTVTTVDKNGFISVPLSDVYDSAATGLAKQLVVLRRRPWRLGVTREP